MGNVEKFYQDAEKDKTLQMKLEELYKTRSDQGRLDSAVLVQFANEAGYHFSVADLEQFQQAKQVERGEVDGLTPGNPWTCWERWLTFNFMCGWDNGFPWKCQYKDLCKQHW